MKNDRLKIFSFLFFVMLFSSAPMVFAQVVITEIMYDPKGADASGGGEWIEVQNTGPASVDLTKWIFFEDDTNHGITADGTIEITPGGYAVISKDLTSFKNYFTFSGLLFKASFSLNDSESLAMKNGKGDPVTDENRVTYSADLGAKNDGNSLQKINDAWKASHPTPGEGGVAIIEESSSPHTTSSDTYQSSPEVSTVTSVQSSPVPRISKITADAGLKNRVALVGASILFEGHVTGINKELIENTQMKWSFGDGAITEGWGTKSVTHVYYYTGEYNVFLEAPTLFVTSDRVRVRVVAPQIMLRLGGDMARSFISLENRSSDELDMTGWKIFSGGKLVTLPRIILSAKKIVTLPSEATNLSTPEGTFVELRFPNGVPVPLLQDQVLADVVRTSNKAVISVEVVDLSRQNDSRDVIPQNQQNITKPSSVVTATKPLASTQQASVVNALDDTATSGAPIAQPKNESSWPWYIAVAFIGAIAALSLRFVRSKSTPADEFEIIEDKDDKPF